MNVFLFIIIFLLGLIVFFVFLRLGKYTNRRRILNYSIPEGWVEIIQKNIPGFEELSPVSKQEIQEIVQVMVAEKKFISNELGFEVKNFHRVTLASRAAMLSHGSIDPYLEKVTVIPIGGKDSFFQWENDQPVSELWNQVNNYESLGFENFESVYEGTLAQWACFYPYHPAKFKEAVAPMDFDKSLFPLFTEVYFAAPEVLREKFPDVFEYMKKEYEY